MRYEVPERVLPAVARGRLHHGGRSLRGGDEVKSLPGSLGREREERPPMEERLWVVVAIGVAIYLLALLIFGLVVRGLMS
jgi:hypothetical protein